MLTHFTRALVINEPFIIASFTFLLAHMSELTSDFLIPRD